MGNRVNLHVRLTRFFQPMNRAGFELDKKGLTRGKGDSQELSE